MARAFLVDLGGSSLKAGLYELDGTALAIAHVPLSFVEEQAGQAEQDPEIWWQALQTALGEIADRLGEIGEVAAVSICGFTRSQVFLDAQGKAIRPAITFRDSRGHAIAQAALRNEQLAAHDHARHFNGFHPLARQLWLKQNEPECWNRVATIVEPKDYLNFRLTGQLRSDPTSQFWLQQAMQGGEAGFASLAGLDRAVMPPLLEAWQKVGRVSNELPGALAMLAGAAVFCGSNDTWTAVAGLGALQPGFAYCMSGSSEVFGLLSDRAAEAEGLLTLGWGRGVWHLGGPSQNGANALSWIVEQLDHSERPFGERLDDLLAQQSGQSLLFHPFLFGERTPFWDPQLRASFIGLSADHRPGDMVRATMEGVAFINRTILHRAEAAVGGEVQQVFIAGGGARSAVWNQIRANILGRPVTVSSVKEMGLLGCLAVARVGLGLSDNLSEAAASISESSLRFYPQPDAVAHYDALFALFEDTHSMIAESSHRLASLQKPG